MQKINMNDKLKRLAKNITELLLDTAEPQDTYFSLVGLMKKQSDYFQHMSPENVLKLTFYCHSYAKTKSFELSDKMLNNIAFAVLIYNTGNQHREECDYCSGEGQDTCGDCYGNGTTECDECGGSGEEMCNVCEGTGEEEVGGEWVSCSECGGEGVLTCGECLGDGRVTCRTCDGNNYVDCHICDGEGEVDTDEQDYQRYFIVTWDKYIKDRCELTEGHNTITMSEYEFDKLRDKYITLTVSDESVEFADWVEINEMYCTYYNDNPPLESENMQLTTHADNVKFLTKK